jgi:fumarylacetoacetate (FAA) hydrolase family protein
MNHSIGLPADGTFLGRAKVPGIAHPLVVTIRNGSVFDITSNEAPTSRDICAMDDPAAYVASAEGRELSDLDAIAANSFAGSSAKTGTTLLSPVDLQAVKASGVTFVVSAARARDRGAGARRRGPAPMRSAPTSRNISGTICRS